MVNLVALGEVVTSLGFAPSDRIVRQRINAVEQQTIYLPSDMINSDGSLDVYDDVLRLFRPTYQKNHPAIQCAGWVGYIPLNDRYALEVGTRVPVSNLERMVGMAAGYSPEILRQYTRPFGQTDERPAALFDMLADQLLDSFDHIWDNGLLKTYERVKRAGQSPVGRVMPFQTGLRSARAGRPVAVSSAFHRSSDFGPNRAIKHSLEKLLARYVTIAEDSQRKRTQRLRRALERLGDVGPLTASEANPKAIARYVDRLPSGHERYGDALMVAQLIIYDVGLSIRNTGGVAILPTILINMAVVFEDYVRRVLADGLREGARVQVKDGNKGGDGGARRLLFDPIAVPFVNPEVTPDIVIEVDGRTALVIDVKYKDAPKIPERSDVNQVVLYGAKYEASQVMLLHAGRPNGRNSVELCGQVGSYKVYNGMMNLDTSNVVEEELKFVDAVRSLLP